MKARILIFGTVVLLAAAIALKQYFNWDWATALGFTGIVGTAAGIASLHQSKTRERKARVIVVEAWIFLKSQPFFEYKFGARVVNDGDKPDLLHPIQFQFYHRQYGFIRSVLVCGARELTKEKGHILPFEIQPRTTVLVEGIGTIPMVAPIAEPLIANEDWDNYVLRCTFQFSSAPPVTIRVGRSGIIKKGSAAQTAKEILLKLKTRGRNPMTDGTRVN